MGLYLIKPGELTLKGNNRKEFESILKRNMVTMLRGTGASLHLTEGRYFVRCSEEQEGAVEGVLNRIIGIAGWARARFCEKNMEALIATVIEEARGLASQGYRTYKLEARRSDKSFPLDSYGIVCAVGEEIRKALPELTVQVQNPQIVIHIEVRERVYVYSLTHQGRRGLPVGSAGRGLLLLSGGIDSPVAGYLMACRGMKLDSIYFHAYPYTSEEAQRKVARLAEILGSYTLGMRLFTIPFTAVQLRIKERAPDAWTTVLLRMAMMEAADRLASTIDARALVTGESLSQVASQTIENIRCTESTTVLPVLRPLIGLDKEETIRLAREIGTYDVSILPYEDCCVLFSPVHPIIHAPYDEARDLYAACELQGLIEEAVRNKKVEKLGYPS
ncbi:MAG TPA: tRNA uracil 4-sulfurtransferase ThiI [Termitinemataceae bacterium]|nr:tRNA uracil 4-sulfurtransferase ThiI [Termitinemataceae bacterium]HOM24411.1 tRNA uracil 4-sulfurtransferase ThiI [Termitinemataceae bacterium]HPQ01297.1 tRNA uracil 4-sulfurtransferase ThiI [Termitinemataceae bacterium]